MKVKDEVSAASAASYKVKTPPAQLCTMSNLGLQSQIWLSDFTLLIYICDFD